MKTVKLVKVIFDDGSEKEFRDGFLFGVGENGNEVYGVVRGNDRLLALENAVLEKAAIILGKRAEFAISLLAHAKILSLLAHVQTLKNGENE